MAPISNPPANRDVKGMAMLSSPSFHALLTVLRTFRSAFLPLAAVLVLCPGGTPLKAELLLVEDGRPRSTIVMGARASAKERLAAEELRTYLHKISGAYVSIATDADNISGTRILVGRNRYSAALGLQTAGLERDGYLIDVRGSDLVLLGETDQGSMNAVYGFLEDHLDVRWFMPGEAGEDVLRRQTIRIPALQERRKPDFLAVSGLIWSGHTPVSSGLAEAQPRLHRSAQLFLRPQLSQHSPGNAPAPRQASRLVRAQLQKRKQEIRAVVHLPPGCHRHRRQKGGPLLRPHARSRHLRSCPGRRQVRRFLQRLALPRPRRKDRGEKTDFSRTD